MNDCLCGCKWWEHDIDTKVCLSMDCVCFGYEAAPENTYCVVAQLLDAKLHSVEREDP